MYEVEAPVPFGGRAEGRDAVLAFLQCSVDDFDRSFDERVLELVAGPEERDQRLWVRWRATYRRAGVADVTLDGEEIEEFEGDRIRRLEDRIANPAATSPGG